jgi:hypothetical protein
LPPAAPPASCSSRCGSGLRLVSRCRPLKPYERADHDAMCRFFCFEERESCDANGPGMPDHTRGSRSARQGKGKVLQNLNGQGPCAQDRVVRKTNKGCPEEQPPPQQQARPPSCGTRERVWACQATSEVSALITAVATSCSPSVAPFSHDVCDCEGVSCVRSPRVKACLKKFFL